MNTIDVYLNTNLENELSDWWDAVESGAEYEPICCLCDNIIATRGESVEVFFKNDFLPGETIDENLDLGLAAHKTCIDSGLTLIEKW